MVRETKSCREMKRQEDEETHGNRLGNLETLRNFAGWEIFAPRRISATSTPVFNYSCKTKYQKKYEYSHMKVKNYNKIIGYHKKKMKDHKYLN